MNEPEKNENNEKTPKLGLLAVLIFILVIAAYMAIDRLLLTPFIDYIRAL